MTDPYFIQSLELAGFRAYLKPKTFDFSKKRCLAIFAPNGSGKSSIIDALEFMFSKDGTLDRLGQRAINNQAGPGALVHNLAEGAGILPMVTIGVISGKNTTKGNRPAAGAKRPIPTIATTMNACFTVPPIIRGHTLRTFVESHTPEERYTDMAYWLKLGPLVEVQKNIRALRTQVRNAVEDETALRHVDTQLARETKQGVKAWDASAVLDYVNISVLAPLDPALMLVTLAVGDRSYAELEMRAKAEESEIGLAGLRQIRNAATALWVKTADAKNGNTFISGTLPDFDAAVLTLSAAERKELEERGKAANTVFQALWEAAEPIFADDVLAPDTCPVCTTPLAKTTAGSAETIREHIRKHLGQLSDYAAAKRALDEAQAAASKAHTKLVAALPTLIGLLGDGEAALKADLTAFQSGIAGWQQGSTPASNDIVTAIAKLLSGLNQSINDIEAKQGDHTYLKAKAKIDLLLEMQADRNLTLRTQDELRKLSNALTAQASTISGEIRKKVQALVDRLQTPMNDIYKLIQGAGYTIRDKELIVLVVKIGNRKEVYR